MKQLKLNVVRTREVTTKDLNIYCGDEPLRFEAAANIHASQKMRKALIDWVEKDYPIDKAIELVPQMFKSVSQNGTSYPLTTVEDARALYEAVGDNLFISIVERYWTYDFNFFLKMQPGSVSLPPPPENGENSEPQP